MSNRRSTHRTFELVGAALLLLAPALASAQLSPTPFSRDSLNLRGGGGGTRPTAIIFDEVGPVSRVVVTTQFNAGSLWRGYEENVVGCKVFFDGVPQSGTVVRIPPFRDGDQCTYWSMLAIYVEADAAGVAGTYYTCSEGTVGMSPCCDVLGDCEPEEPVRPACDLTGVWKNSTSVTTYWSLARSAASPERQRAAGLVPREMYKALERGGCNAEGSATYEPEYGTITLGWSCTEGYSGKYSWTLDEGSCDRATGEVVHFGPKIKGRRFPSTITREE